MNCYFLVEGEETEMHFYPRLINYFKPNYSRIYKVSDFKQNNFYMFSGGGYPNIFKKLNSAIAEIGDFNKNHKHQGIKIDWLYLVIDSDVYPSYDVAVRSIDDRIAKVKDKCKEAKVRIKPIIQNCCIETWFLGNSEMFPQNYNSEFKKYVDVYDVSKKDPEDMIPPNSMPKGQYAYAYLVSMLLQNGYTYAKTESGANIVDANYIKNMHNRCLNLKHIKSFKLACDLINKL